jgi:hypothetical protein
MIINKKTFTVYQNLHYLLVIFFIFILPFNALIQTFIRYQLEVSWFQFAKEIILILILGLNAVSTIKAKQWHKLKSTLIYVSMIYLAYILISTFFLESISLQSIIHGFKYDGIWTVCLIAGLTLPDYITAKKQDILKIVAGTIFSAVSLGLFLHYIVRPENLQFLGYRNDWSTYYANQALAFCQRIEHSSLCRFQGTFSGPNQAGANILLLIASLSVYVKRNSYNIWVSICGVSLILLSLFSTYSRSSWIALMVFIGLVVLKTQKNILSNLTLLIFSVVLIFGIISVNMPETIYRYGSNSERVAKVVQSVEIGLKQPVFGYGIGYSGPASHVRSEPIITENWFLQVFINYGMIGLVLFCWIYLLCIKRLLGSKEYLRLGLFLIALLVPLNLLHYFEDSSFSYLLFLIIGMVLTNEQSPRIDQKL